MFSDTAVTDGHSAVHDSSSKTTSSNMTVGQKWHNVEHDSFSSMTVGKKLPKNKYQSTTFGKIFSS